MFWKVRAMPRSATRCGANPVSSFCSKKIFPEVALGRVVDAGDQVEDRGLARPVGPDDGEDLALLDLEAHAVHGPDAPEVHHELVDGEERHRSRSERM